MGVSGRPRYQDDGREFISKQRFDLFFERAISRLSITRSDVAKCLGVKVSDLERIGNRSLMLTPAQCKRLGPMFCMPSQELYDFQRSGKPAN